MVDVDDVVTDVVADNVIMGGALGRHYLCVLYSGVSLVVFWGQHNTSSRLQGVASSRLHFFAWWGLLGGRALAR